ncbi:MAG: hypothetical protein V3T00_08545 [bacterium]
MNKILVAIAAGAAALFAASTASAVMLSLDIPVAYEFEDGGSADEITGFKAGVALPLSPAFLVGVAYQGYEVKDEDGTADLTADFEIIDIFIELPFPIVNIGLGAGQGTVNVEAISLDPLFPFSPVDEELDVTEVFVTLGLPIGVWDLHVGWHQVDVEEFDVTIPGSGTFPADISGTMWSVGASIFFK